MEKDLYDPRVIEGLNALFALNPSKKDLYRKIIKDLPNSLFIPTINQGIIPNSLSKTQTWDLDYIETFNELGNEYIVKWEWIFKDFIPSTTYQKWSTLSNEYKIKMICYLLEEKNNGKSYTLPSYSFKKGTLKDWR
ncbi:MAG: hypothetical protein E7273_10640 [Pseudobutyrivibrio ruminis]|nr:hypothetical protein [Pseudobutyrivibrio ruminis]